MATPAMPQPRTLAARPWISARQWRSSIASSPAAATASSSRGTPSGPRTPNIPIVTPSEALGSLAGSWIAYLKPLRDWGNRLPGFEKEVSGAMHKDTDCHFGC